jgi:FG-GAP-like repeat
MKTHSFMHLSIVTSVLALAACQAEVAPDPSVSPGQPPDDDVGEDSDALTGSISYESNCGSDVRPDLDRAMKWGRIAASSAAFKACIANLRSGTAGIAAKYLPQCSPADPHDSEAAQAQIDALLKWTSSPNPLTMSCPGTPSCSDPNANACASVLNEQIKSESLTWTGWLNQVAGKLGSIPGDPWWPTTQMASIIWHEAMHNYGYTHPATCSTPGYNFQSNTIPYIVQACMQSVLSESGKGCGPADSCGSNSLPIITTPTVGSTTCTCVKDPRAGAKLFFADVNGDGRADAIVVNKKAPIAVRLSTGSSFGDETFWSNIPSFGDRGTFFADVTGDGKADAIFVNNDGIRVRPSNGSFFTGNAFWTNIPSFGDRGTFFADVTGDGKADAIFVNNDGIRVRPSNGSFFNGNALWTNIPSFGDRGTFFADVTGDGKADAIFVNNDGIRVRPSNGSFFNGNALWTNQPSFGDRGTFFVDVTGDGKADAIFVNNDGIRVRPSNGSFFTGNAFWTNQPSFGSQGTFFADTTGDHKADAIFANTNWVTVRPSSGSFFNGNAAWTKGPLLP